jgi:hypothetical protein
VKRKRKYEPDAGQAKFFSFDPMGHTVGFFLGIFVARRIKESSSQMLLANVDRNSLSLLRRFSFISRMGTVGLGDILPTEPFSLSDMFGNLRFFRVVGYHLDFEKARMDCHACSIQEIVHSNSIRYSFFELVVFGVDAALTRAPRRARLPFFSCR